MGEHMSPTARGVSEETKHLVAGDMAALSQRRGPRELWVNDIGAVSWAEFGAAVQAAQNQCIGNRVRHGSVVEVVVSERLGFLAWMFGAAAAGVIVAPVRGGDSPGSVLKDFVEVSWRVTDGRIE